MAKLTANQIEDRLRLVLEELETQTSVASSYLPGYLSFDDEMKQLREWIDEAREYGIAYESIVAALDTHPFRITGKAAVALLEVGLTIAVSD